LPIRGEEIKQGYQLAVMGALVQLIAKVVVVKCWKLLVVHARQRPVRVEYVMWLVREEIVQG